MYMPNLLKEAFYHNPQIQENTFQTMSLCASCHVQTFSISEQIGTLKEVAQVSLTRRDKEIEVRIKTQTGIPGC